MLPTAPVISDFLQASFRNFLFVTFVVTIGRRPPGTVVGNEAVQLRKGMRKMDTSTADKSKVKWAARFAYAAGATGILANPFFIAFPVRRPATRKMGFYPVRSERMPHSNGRATDRSRRR